MRQTHKYVHSFMRYKKSNPGANSLDEGFALNKLFKIAQDDGIEEGMKIAKEKGDFIKRPECDEEKLAYMIKKNPELITLINKFDLEM